MSGLKIPVATYRLQFNNQFRFPDAGELVSYLYRLGISDLYASPIFKARKGSTHGYDVTDPTSLNPELGTEADFNALVRELEKLEMGLLLDVVPNHLAASPENSWWRDVLENGICSPYARFFDIDWSALNGRVLLPVLNRPYHDVLENNEFSITLNDDGIFLRYSGLLLPLDIKSYGLVLSYYLDSAKSVLDFDPPERRELRRLISFAENLPTVSAINSRQTVSRYRCRQKLKESFLQLTETSSRLKNGLLHIFALLNKTPGEIENRRLTHNILEQQAYRLDYWQTARGKINYRRFFDINDLIGIRIEEPKVFQATHSLLLQLVREGKVSGLRIDHIDGLKDPLGYLRSLQEQIEAVSAETSIRRIYVVVEKVLAPGEVLPAKWPVFGTTGYDFANILNTIFIDSEGIRRLNEIYIRFTGSPVTLDDIVYEKKKLVIKELFPDEIRSLGQSLGKLADTDRAGCPVEELSKALIAITSCLPVYRTYIRSSRVSSQDRSYLEQAVAEAQRRNPDISPVALDLLRDVLIMNCPRSFTSVPKAAWLDFVLRWQQFTGTVMAKGFEDTVLYTSNRLISLNEVGGNPDSTGLSIAGFHRWNQARSVRQPHSFNATSTHDTKRSEDVRSRINVLSEIPDQWERHLTEWQRYNEPSKQVVNGKQVPEPNMEIFIYQTLVGAWPLYENEVAGFKQRLKAYLIKAAREAKTYTGWLSPDFAYEGALINFVESILDGTGENAFLSDFLSFAEKIAYYGMLNSLAQVLIKITSPGVPDFYQGTELWDFSLVDPDNRRPVDFEQRTRMLNEIINDESQDRKLLVRQLLESWRDGRIKLYLTYRALGIRKSYRSLFQEGDYRPVRVIGRRQENIYTFTRHKGENWILVVIPRLFTKSTGRGVIPFSEDVWGDDVLSLSDGTPDCWTDLFTAKKHEVSGKKRELRLSDLLCEFPVGLLAGM